VTYDKGRVPFLDGQRQSSIMLSLFYGSSLARERRAMLVRVCVLGAHLECSLRDIFLIEALAQVE
jgi:hypothetical protein